MRLKERIAIVTGAGSGLGRATAVLFAAEGAHVVLVGRREAKLRETAALAGAGTTCAALDVAAPRAMHELAQRTAAAHGRIDALVTCAGIVHGRNAALETTDEDWDETLRVNLTGTHRSCTAVLEVMTDQQPAGGAIVTLSSICGQIAVPARASYAASKAGVVGYTRNLAIDYARFGVRANALSPAFVETDINRASLHAVKADPERWQALLDLHPLGLGRPQDVAHAALFLCSDEARWITGVDLPVDGGYLAR
ncbi:MAG TPA: SDR family oxidoreductase [Planctomycetota bacterium]